jgi:hypothetical protein
MANGHRFAELFRKYRLRSQIKTLAEFGDLLAEEGIIYENSLFTRWQNGERVPTSRKIVLIIIQIFIKRKAIESIDEANQLLESLSFRDLTSVEIEELSKYLNPTINNLLPIEPINFIGREGVLKNITWEIINNGKIWIYGIPGSGKTAIAVKLGNKLRNFFSDGVFFYRCEDDNFINSIDKFLDFFEINVRGISDYQLKFEILKKELINKKILLIFDNIQTNTENNQILNIIVTLPVSIVFTSLELNQNEHLSLIKNENFTPDEFFQLADLLLGKLYVDDNKQSLLNLGKNIRFSPICSVIALNQILTSPKMMNKLTHHLDLDRINYDNKNLYTSIDICFHNLSKNNQELLISTSIFKGDDFSISILRDLYDGNKKIITDNVNYLADLSMVERCNQDRFRLHPLIKEYLIGKVSNKTYITLFNYYLNELADYDKVSSKKNCFLNREYKNILGLTVTLFDIKEYQKVISLYELINKYLFERGLWNEIFKLIKILEKSYIYCDNKHGLGQFLIEDLARIYFFQNNIRVAHSTLDKAKNIAVKTNDPILLALVNQKIGIMLMNSQQYIEAEGQLLNAYNAFKNTKLNKEDLIKCCAYLGVNYAKKGDFVLAEKYLKIAWNSTQSNNEILGMISIYLGQAYQNLNKPYLAKKYLEKGYLIEKKRRVLIGQAYALLGLGQWLKTSRCHPNKSLPISKPWIKSWD